MGGVNAQRPAALGLLTLDQEIAVRKAIDSNGSWPCPSAWIATRRGILSAQVVDADNFNVFIDAYEGLLIIAAEALKD